MQQCGSSQTTVVALNQFLCVKLSWWSSFPPESSSSSVFTAEWRTPHYFLHFQKKRKKKKSHFISFIKKKKLQLGVENNTKSSSSHFQSLFQDIWESQPISLRMRCREIKKQPCVEIRTYSDVNLWCRLNLWVNIKKEGSYNLLCSSFCSSVSRVNLVSAPVSVRR